MQDDIHSHPIHAHFYQFCYTWCTDINRFLQRTCSRPRVSVPAVYSRFLDCFPLFKDPRLQRRPFLGVLSCRQVSKLFCGCTMVLRFMLEVMVLHSLCLHSYLPLNSSSMTAAGWVWMCENGCVCHVTTVDLRMCVRVFLSDFCSSFFLPLIYDGSSVMKSTMSACSSVSPSLSLILSLFDSSQLRPTCVLTTFTCFLLTSRIFFTSNVGSQTT